MNLMYCGNERVLDGVMLSLLSIMQHTKADIHVFLLTMDMQQADADYRPITDVQAGRLREVLTKENPNNTLVLKNITDVFWSQMGDSVNMANFYTPYCMLRLLADCLPFLPDKILYLDTDTIAYGDVKELYNIDIADYEYGAAIDYLGKIFKYPTYKNSGVLLMNLAMMRQTQILRRTRHRCITKKMAFPDQDALNKETTKALRIPSKYNEQRRKKKDTVIRHFCKSLRIVPYIHTVNVKPWEMERMRSVMKVHDLEGIYRVWNEIRVGFEQIYSGEEKPCQNEF